MGHQSIRDPKQRAYGKVRAVRATTLDAATFEVLCQDAGIQEEDGTVYGELPDHSYDPLVYRAPSQFAQVGSELQAAYKSRCGQNWQPSLETPDFSFYSAAHDEFVDEYWQARIVANDVGAGGVPGLVALSERLQTFDAAYRAVVGDNLSAMLDLYAAVGVGLCRAKGRICSDEELTESFIDNFAMVTAAASGVRQRLQGDHVALPFDYGSSVLRGDPDMLRQNYWVVTKEEASTWDDGATHRYKMAHEHTLATARRPTTTRFGHGPMPNIKPYGE